MANLQKRVSSLERPEEPEDLSPPCCGLLSLLTWDDRKTICSIMAANMFYGLTLGLIVPFYAIEATARGLSQAAVGTVVFLYAMALCVGSLISSQLIPVLGASHTLHLGALLAGSATLVFASLSLVQSGAAFLVLSCILRVLEALGTAALFTASSTIIANQYPKDVSFWMGILDNAMMMGVAIGPAMGGGLYDLGGLALPFAALGCAIFVVMSFSWCTSPVIGGDPQRVPWLLMSTKMVQSSEGWLNALVLVVMGGMWCGVDPYIEVYISGSMGVTPKTFGLCFLLSSVGALIGGPLFGRLSDLVSNTYPHMTACLLLASAGLLTIGPPAWTGIPPSAVLLTVGLTIRDFALTGVYVPVFANLLRAGADVGLPDTLSTQAYISGLLATWYALGNAVGALLAGAVVDVAGFPAAAVTMAGAGLVVAVLVAVQAVLRGWNRPPWPGTASVPLLGNGGVEHNE